MNKAVEILKAVLCDQECNVCIHGSDRDLEIINTSLRELEQTPSLEAIIAKIEAEKEAYHLEDDRYDIGARAFADKAISIIREFQTNQTKGN